MDKLIFVFFKPLTHSQTHHVYIYRERERERETTETEKYEMQ